MSVALTILVDNHSADAALKAEHGLSLLLSSPTRRVLYDAGATAETLLHNAAQLGVPLESVDAVILSHGHYDHTGGLEAVVRCRRGMHVYAHPDAFARRWAEKPGETLRDISCPHHLRKLCELGAVIHAVKAPEKLDGWLVLSGPIGGPPAGPAHFVVRRGDQMCRDGFEDELFAMVRGRSGWAVVSGCCHRGVRNTLKAARFLAKGEPIVAFVGGLHLGSATDEEIDEAAAALEAASGDTPLDLYPLHCTGQKAVEAFRKRFGERVHPAAGGTKIEW
ncbi:MAG TPA: MBL fold metallo-hydrolase [Phycisphaerae bacterium]|nr:MBL fold metallo-hydrolase [Phycisphaerae bacterium]